MEGAAFQDVGQGERNIHAMDAMAPGFCQFDCHENRS